MTDEALDQLIDGHLDGTLTPDEAAQLSEALETSAAARERYWTAASLPALLDGALEQLDREPPVMVRRRRAWLAGAAAAALLVLAAASWWGARPAAGSAGPLRPQFATVSNASEAVEFRLGQRLPAGRLRLPAGRLGLTFDCGAVVELVGPAELELESEFRGFLHHGQLTAQVPPPAQGFIIQTPQGQIRDLGTAFGLAVKAEGGSEVHVLEGSVEATGTGPAATPQLITASQARRFTAARLEPAAYDGARFQPRLPLHPPAGPPLLFSHWSFDEPSGADFSDTAQRHRLTASILDSPRSAGRPLAERLTPGIAGRALSFNGEGEFATTTHPGFAGTTPRTVALWVRLPLQPKPGSRNCFLGWGTSGAMTKWEMLWNQVASEGTPGALRLEFGLGHVIGSTNLRTGRWHHLAIVYHGEAGADVTTHIKLYVDGRLDPLSGRRPQRIQTDTTSPAAVPLTLGRYLDYRANYPRLYFHGEIDELHLIEAALTPAEIEKLSLRQPLP
jgi:hypothetical protein